MTTNLEPFNSTPALARKLVVEQFPEFSHLSITEVGKQGHDNRTYRLGDDKLIRLPSMACYALAVEKEQQFLPRLAAHLTINIPIPIKVGNPSTDFPFPFSIYAWLPGTSLSDVNLEEKEQEEIALDLAKFLKELQGIEHMGGPIPGQHNWWRGAHISIYDKGARQQIAALAGIIDTDKAIKLWEQACCQTTWDKPPVWIHGDFAVDNFLVQAGKLSAVIDFGCMGIGDPACDLVIAWTFLKDKSRQLFIHEIELDEGTWLRAKAWALWKATFELCQLSDKNSLKAIIHRKIIDEVLDQ